MKSSFKYTASLLLLLFISACSDFFSTTLEIDPPEHETALVVHAYFSDTDTTLAVALTKSFGLLETQSDDQFIRNAQIEFQLENESPISFDTIPQQPVGNFARFNYMAQTADSIGGNNQTFTLKAAHPDFPSVTATQVMPKAVPIRSIELKENAGIDDFGERVDGVEITFDDPEGEDNYYEFALYALEEFNGDFYINSFFTYSNDFNVEESLDFDFHLLNDGTFNGKEYKFTLLFENYREPSDELTLFVVWRCLTKELYQYSKSVRDFRSSADLGLFTEPVTIFSNIENGLGIFGLRTERYIEVER
ncbi:MAG: DUF4249 domain-containing protein [Bacteroidota bacterium]